MVNYDLWEANIICDRKPDGFRYVMIDPERGFWGDPGDGIQLLLSGGKPLKEKQQSMQIYNKLAREPITVRAR